MSVGRDLGKFSGDYRKALTAVMLVGIMLFSTQMYSFKDFETYDEKSSVVGDAQDREPFQQSGQAEWPPSDISQPTGVQQHFFNHLLACNGGTIGADDLGFSHEIFLKKGPHCCL